ncbi:hypothetical protein F5884DRAFT_744529 [Xylogone sp. PMI_703]|nr:hypothetical protein F5884DRAFT_744529 [Xylogone sp. PMI_703]
MYSDSEHTHIHGRESSESLLHDEHGEPKVERKTQHRFAASRAKSLIGLGLGVILLLSLTTIWMSQPTCKAETRPDPPDRHYCGKTSEEAVQRGCRYEPMYSSWIPDICYTTEPAPEYDPYSDLDWYSDVDLKYPLTEREMAGLRQGNFTRVYTTWRYHDQHCLYAWRKLAIAVEKRLPFIDTKSVEIEHSEHCAKNLTNYVRHEKDYVAEMNIGSFMIPMMMQGCVALF